MRVIPIFLNFPCSLQSIFKFSCLITRAECTFSFFINATYSTILQRISVIHCIQNTCVSTFKTLRVMKFIYIKQIDKQILNISYSFSICCITRINIERSTFNSFCPIRKYFCSIIFICFALI